MNCKAPWPRGLVTALVTPLQEDRIDHDAFARLIEYQIAAGAAGLIVTGGTGEYGALSFEERAGLYARAVACAAGRVPVFAAPACLSTTETIALSLRAAEAGAAGLLLASPFGEPISWKERRAFYREMAEAVSLPIMIYNTPPAGLLSFVQIAELAEIPGISAVKDSSGDAELMGDLLAWRGGRDFAVYVGKDAFLFEAITGGADGAVFGAANFVPAEIAAFITLVQGGAGLETIRDRWRVLRPLMRLMEGATNYVGLCKAGCGLRGLDMGQVRRPYRMPGPAEVASVKDWLTNVDTGAATTR